MTEEMGQGTEIPLNIKKRFPTETMDMTNETVV
jgi:hypothetical protein